MSTLIEQFCLLYMHSLHSQVSSDIKEGESKLSGLKEEIVQLCLYLLAAHEH